MKKIIGFDSWTGGAQHFQRLMPALFERSMQLMLIHIGSWGNQPNCPREEQINGLLVRDISYYGTDALEKILDIEKPDAVILTSTETFAHRAFIRYCRQRSIPTLNLYHGLVNVQDIEGEISSSGGVPSIAYIKYVVARIGKLIRHTLPCYSRALWKTKASLSEWRRFLSDMVDLAVGAGSFWKGASDSKTTKCAVYVEADIEHAVGTFGFNREDVYAVGIPDFIHFGLHKEMVGKWAPSADKSLKSVMYIETGFSSIGVYFSSTQDFATHLINAAHDLSRQGYKVCVKLKPRQVNTEILERLLKEAEIELVSNQEFLQKLNLCSACITETTTLAMMPAALGMPLFLAKFGKLSPLNYGSVLTSYPRGYLLDDVGSVSGLLARDFESLNLDNLTQWIKLNTGPFPAEKMPERVVDIIDEMI
ncbi:MAG: hypothetical protein ACYC58_00575 [Pseudomonadaceae bacterium]